MQAPNSASTTQEPYCGNPGRSSWLSLAFAQPPNVALLRRPGRRRYGKPVPACQPARELWEYAVLSALAYEDVWKSGNGIPPPLGVQVPAEWRRWDEFPPENLKAAALKMGLFFEVWECDTVGAWKVVVVFRGTEFWSWRDWRSNLRWLRLWAGWSEDQYTVVAEKLGMAFCEEIRRRSSGRPEAVIVATGHSLGGGLAQHFAYSLPEAPDVPRVKRVVAFDPSPVTGWRSVPKGLRTKNAGKLVICRVFEHGEILAYLRLLISRFIAPRQKGPAIWEIRFNFFSSPNPIGNHAMPPLAEALAKAASCPCPAAKALCETPLE